MNIMLYWRIFETRDWDNKTHVYNIYWGNKSREKASYFLRFLYSQMSRPLIVSRENARFETLPHLLHSAEPEVATRALLTLAWCIGNVSSLALRYVFFINGGLAGEIYCYWLSVVFLLTIVIDMKTCNVYGPCTNKINKSLQEILCQSISKLL